MTNKDQDHRKVATHILATANAIVTTERGNQHGGAEDSFQMIADLWTSYLRHTNRQGNLYITAKDVAQMMVMLKIARHTYGDPTNPDNFFDAAGYTALAAALAGIQAPPPPTGVKTTPVPQPAAPAPKHDMPVTRSVVNTGGGELAKTTKPPEEDDVLRKAVAGLNEELN